MHAELIIPGIASECVADLQQSMLPTASAHASVGIIATEPHASFSTT